MMQVDGRERRRVEDVVSQAVGAAEDGVLSESDRRELNQVLATDSHARSFYLNLTALRVLLLSTAGRSAGKLSEDHAIKLAYRLPAGSSTEPNRPPVSPRDQNEGTSALSSGSRRRFRLSPQFVVAATLVGVLVTGVFAVRFAGLNSEVALDDRAQSTPIADRKPDSGDTTRANVASVSSVKNAVWKDPNESLAVETSLRSGEVIHLLQGEIELTYASGVRLRLIGPGEYRLKAEGGVLSRGGLLAQVPEAGHGFTVETPNGSVVDLGTEFGIVVDDFGFSEVGVFKGKVEAHPLTASGISDSSAAQEKLELSEGDGLLWTKTKLTKVATDARRFTAARLSPQHTDSVKPAGTKLSQSPNQDASSESSWQSLGSAEPTGDGFLIKDAGDDGRSYLLSRRQYNPSDGQVVVQCDVVFPEDQEHSGDASFAILTRSTDERGDAVAPWQDMLSTCVRCSFGVDADAGVGVLDTATKYDRGWHPVALSWKGFRKPTPGERYLLTMMDDGLGVTFTVALAANPDISKTVRCRSLFRGTSNHVAFEGPRIGSALVENIRIYQESRPLLETAGLFEAAGDTAGATPEATDQATKAYEELLPTNARLLISDSFDRGQVDSEVWNPLGHAVVANGKLQLGKFSEDANTWQLRPYLLTRETFSPLDGEITVVGKFEFAENYLTGYGGSFAVMTRCSATHRGGEGWEQSLLTRGLRSNFWPIGLGVPSKLGVEEGHSLELHQILPDREKAEKLSGARYAISPSKRAYFFRVVDDGKSVRLTVVDPSDPQRRGVLTYDSVTNPSDPGHIGVESSWGSPIYLDEIRIFQAGNN